MKTILNAYKLEFVEYGFGNRAAKRDMIDVALTQCSKNYANYNGFGCFNVFRRL